MYINILRPMSADAELILYIKLDTDEGIKRKQEKTKSPVMRTA